MVLDKKGPNWFALSRICPNVAQTHTQKKKFFAHNEQTLDKYLRFDNT